MCTLLKHACKTWPKLAYLENAYGRRKPFQQTLICYISTMPQLVKCFPHCQSMLAPKRFCPHEINLKAKNKEHWSTRCACHKFWPSNTNHLCFFLVPPSGLNNKLCMCDIKQCVFWHVIKSKCVFQKLGHTNIGNLKS